MAAPARVLPADVDFSRLPKAWAGQWIVIDADLRRVLGRGKTLQDAIDMAVRDYGIDLSEPEIVLSRVPSGQAILVL